MCAKLVLKVTVVCHEVLVLILYQYLTAAAHPLSLVVIHVWSTGKQPVENVLY